MCREEEGICKTEWKAIDYDEETEKNIGDYKKCWIMKLIIFALHTKG